MRRIGGVKIEWGCLHRRTSNLKTFIESRNCKHIYIYIYTSLEKENNEIE